MVSMYPLTHSSQVWVDINARVLSNLVIKRVIRLPDMDCLYGNQWLEERRKECEYFAYFETFSLASLTAGMERKFKLKFVLKDQVADVGSGVLTFKYNVS